MNNISLWIFIKK